MSRVHVDVWLRLRVLVPQKIDQRLLVLRNCHLAKVLLNVGVYRILPSSKVKNDPQHGVQVLWSNVKMLVQLNSGIVHAIELLRFVRMEDGEVRQKAVDSISQSFCLLLVELLNVLTLEIFVNTFKVFLLQDWVFCKLAMERLKPDSSLSLSWWKIFEGFREHWDLPMSIRQLNCCLLHPDLLPPFCGAIWVWIDCNSNGF